MGPEGERPVYYTADGQEIGRPVELSISEPDMTPPAFWTGPLPATVTVDIDDEAVEVKVSRVSRRRLVKLLMSSGIQRNDANRMAARIRSVGRGYAHYLLFCVMSVLAMKRGRGDADHRD